jgi:hypothetical protein
MLTRSTPVEDSKEPAWRRRGLWTSPPKAPPHPQPAVIVPPDPEVVATPTRRRFTAENKLRILKLADACTAVGSLGPCCAPKDSTPRTLRHGVANARTGCCRP